MRGRAAGDARLVGDKLTDIEAAQGAGLAGAMHVITGHGKAELAQVSAEGAPFEVRFGALIADAAAVRHREREAR